MNHEGDRERLLQERRNVADKMGLKFDGIAQSGRAGEEDQAQVSHDEFVSMQINTLHSGKLRLINEALQRIQDGDYGICLHCEQPIPARRLEVIPWAKFCVPCQDRLVLLERESGAEAELRENEFAES
ncbi:MAG TPA: TraR/DksA C4-type zinc finger protein [Bryobacteraceae bacterium]|nr:TraR/DksA C4-type zinc finger protein [Bryobacteraceae bacterium]